MEISETFKKIKRIDFLPDEVKHLADLDEPLPIGFGQTISQPLVAAFMLEILEPKEGEKILDMGFGSGWTTALLAEIVGKKGKVMAMEIIPELAEFGKNNIAKYDFIKNGVVEILCADGSRGYKKEAPYDKILASAALAAAKGGKEDLSSLTSTRNEIPQAWKDQLKIGGRIVAPIENSIWLFIKKSENEFSSQEFPGFIFVPLISRDREK